MRNEQEENLLALITLITIPDRYSRYYHVGYCTISSDCSTKTVAVTSADQNYTSSTTSPQNITVSASSLTIPPPQGSNWLYIELHATATVTGGIFVRMNNTDANTADTYIDIPSLTVPEFIGFLVPAAPFLPRLVKNLKDRFRRQRRSKKLWRPPK